MDNPYSPGHIFSSGILQDFVLSKPVGAGGHMVVLPEDPMEIAGIVIACEGDNILHRKSGG